MARLNTRVTGASIYRDTTPATSQGRRSPPSPTPPSASFSSDKENRGSSHTTPGSKHPPVATSMNGNGRKRRQEEQGGAKNAKRRSTGDDAAEADEEGDQEEEQGEERKYYDPNQNPEERRAVRMSLRKNARELQDRQDEFLNGDGTALVALIQKQNKTMDSVKNTSDATMDSRFMINSADLQYKKSRLETVGDGLLGIDLDEFLSKCITFMSHGRALGADDEGDGAPNTATQARGRNRRTGVDDDDDEDDNDGNEMNWHVLGVKACFPNNRRPTAPSFLLGPLSVEKRVRATQRRATQRRDPAVAASRPQELREQDLEKNDNSNTTFQSHRIGQLLRQVSAAGAQGVSEGESQVDEDDEEAARDLFSKNNLAMNWCVPLLKFAINPRSFGQTVENLFYISFLVRDGLVKVETDEDSGFPTLRPQEPKGQDEARQSGEKRHQAIFSITYKEWMIFKSAMGLRDSLIPHREEGPAPAAGAWYG